MIVNDLVTQAKQLQQFWLPLVSGLCCVAALYVISNHLTGSLIDTAYHRVTLRLRLPPKLPMTIMYLCTVPPLVVMAATLWRPSSIWPKSIHRDWVMLPPALAAMGVFVVYDGLQEPRCIFQLRVWCWALPLATIGMARELEQSLHDGVAQARRMSELLYNSPGA